MHVLTRKKRREERTKNDWLQMKASSSSNKIPQHLTLNPNSITFIHQTWKKMKPRQDFAYVQN